MYGQAWEMIGLGEEEGKGGEGEGEGERMGKKIHYLMRTFGDV